MMHDCPCDAAGVRTLVLTQREVDQGKMARFNYPLGSDFFCELKFRAWDASAPAPAPAPPAAAADVAAAAPAPALPAPQPAGGVAPSAAPQALQEAWEDD